MFLSVSGNCQLASSPNLPKFYRSQLTPKQTRDVMCWDPQAQSSPLCSFLSSKEMRAPLHGETGAADIVRQMPLSGVHASSETHPIWLMSEAGLVLPIACCQYPPPPSHNVPSPIANFQQAKREYTNHLRHPGTGESVKKECKQYILIAVVT